MATVVEEIYVVTSSGSGHLFPCLELCKHISSRNYKTTLLLPSTLSSSFHHPLITTLELTTSSTDPPMLGPNTDRQQMGLRLEAHLTTRSNEKNSTLPLCAVVDFQMGWTKHIFWKFKIPVISFFTFGACAASMEWGAWKSEAGNMTRGDLRKIPGLPEEMEVTYCDRQIRPSGPPRPDGDGGPPKPGDKPPWVPLIEGSVGLLFNTCHDLERPFIDYLANEMGLPVWVVGPLLPEEYWQSFDSLVSDGTVRQTKHRGNYREDEVIQWLDLKPRGSVLYVAFGSEVGPTNEEYTELASVLEDSTRPFIWVIKSGSGQPDSTESSKMVPDAKVGDRGLIIRGWAPQLLILSHPSTGGFLSHCGWNSTVEAMGRGVPFLTWPIRGDQIYNAKLVVNHLKVGYMVKPRESVGMVKKEDIVKGIEKLMSDEDVHKRAARLRNKLGSGFQANLEANLNAFLNFISEKAV